MKQSTTFAQVATNLLNVLQGYSKSIRLLLVMFVALSVSAEAWGENIFEKLYLSAKNVPQNSSGWTFDNATCNNANSDYWKMIKNTSVVTSPKFDISSYEDVTIEIKWQNYGTFNVNASNATIKVSTAEGEWTTIGKTGLTAKGTDTYTFSNVEDFSSYKQAQIQISTPDADGSNGGRLIYVIITGEEGDTSADFYTVTWDVNGDQSVTTQVAEGSKPTFPATPASCDDESDTFYGWATAKWDGKIDNISDKTIYTSADDMPAVNGAVTYYAVFAKATTTGGGSSNYEKVTSNLTDWSGDYLIAYNNTTFADGRVGGTTSGSGMGAQNIKVDLSGNISNNTIPASVGDQYNVTLVAVNGGYVLQTKDGKYNYQSSNASGLTATTNIATATPYAIKVTFTSENDIKLALTGSANGAVFRYNPSGFFRFYKDGGQNAVYLYKKVEGGSNTIFYNYTTTCTKETTVTLNPNGGLFEAEGWEYDGKNYTQNIVSGDEITLPTPAKKGYYFNGWSDGTYSYTDTDTYTVPAEDVTLNALWKPIEYQITYEGLAGATNGDNPNTYTVESETITFEKPGERVGYTFKGWEPEIIEAGSTGNVTIIATWEKIVLSNNCKWIETEIGDIQSGDEVVITMTKGTYTYALPNTKNTSSAPEATPMDNIVGNRIANVADELKWTVEKKEGYDIFHSIKDATLNLYCNNADDGVRVGSFDNAKTNQEFSISGNYLLNKTTSRYLGVSFNTTPYTWRCYTDTTGVIKNQSLKFYKKTCLMSNEFWIDYELANVTCTNTPPHSQIAKDSETLLLEFTANDGYLLPEDIDVQMENGTLSFDWEKQSGQLTINKPDGGYTGNITITISGCKALATPTNLSAVPTSTSVFLSWDAVADAQSYEVHIMDETNPDIIQTTNTCEITISGLTKASYYVWGVTPIKEGFCGIQETSEFTTLDVFTVTFNNQGKAENFTQQVDAGSKATVPTVPTTTGYTFAGWYTEADTEFNFDTPIESATTLYAKWTEWSYTITYAKGSPADEITGGHAPGTKMYTSALTLAGESFYRPGYKQTGWSKTDGGQKDYNLSGTYGTNEDVTLYPYWTKVHTITWMADGSTHDEATYLDDETLALPETDPEACQGSEFVGWTAEQNYSHATDAPAYITAGSTVNADAIYYAVYAEEIGESDQVIMQYTTKETTNMTGDNDASTLGLDEEWTVIAAKGESNYYPGLNKEGTIRLYYNVDGSNYITVTSPTSKTITDIEITYKKSYNQGVVIVNGNTIAGEELSSDEPIQVLRYSVNATEFIIKNGYTTGNNDQVHITQVLIQTGSTTYANYSTSCIPTYHVNYELAGGENGCVDKGVKVGNDYTICGEEPTRTGYTFQHWTDGANTYEAGATIENVQSNITLTAVWEANTYTITWMANGEEYVTTTHTYDQPLHIADAPYNCYGAKTFMGWTETPSVNENGEGITYIEESTNPSENKTYYAVFADEVVGEPEEVEATLSFANKAQRTSFSSEQQVWEQNGITLTNTQGNADNDAPVADYGNPARFYANSSISIQAPGNITKIVFACNAESYVTPTKNSVGNSAKSDGNNVAVELNASSNTFDIAKVTAQIRLNSLTVTYQSTPETTYSNYTTTPSGCPEIEVAENAYVTSTSGQSVKVNVPITANHFADDITLSATIEGETNFAVVNTSIITDGICTLSIAYKPTSYNLTESAIVTLTAKVGETLITSNSFTIHGRSLPETFVIATKVGATWYALPANMSGATNPEGVVIDVDETTMTATAPNTTVYTLFPVKTTTAPEDRYAQYGDRVRFSAVNNGYNGLWTSSSGSTIRNYAVIDDVKEGSSDASYEWKITTTIVDGNWQYTLQTDQLNNKKYLRYWTAASGGAKWGTYASGNDKLYFLPVTETKPFDYKVVEWYPTKVLIQTEAAITNPIVKIGGILVDNVTCTNKGGKLYEISGLPLVNNPTKVLTLSYTVDEVTYTNSKVVPIILSRETKSISGEPFVALTKEVYNYADLVVRDGATLTMDGTQEANTLWDVTIYPTSKISVPESKKLTVHSLTFFGGIDEIYNGSTYILNKYGVPELSLKGSLKKSISTIDYLMRVNLDQMYSLSVPYDVQLADIKYWDGSDIALGAALYVSAYDGAARANQSKKTWIYETDFESKLGAATLKAGVGYTISAELQSGVGSEYSILRMPMTSNVENDATEGEKKVSVTAHGIDANITDNHKGWNLVGNPYMTTITGADDDDLVLGYLQETGSGPWEWVEKTYRYVTIPVDNGKDYSQQKFTDAVLPPFKNFFVQIGISGDLVFGLSTRKNMRAHHSESSVERDVEFEILMSNATRQDNTGLLISEGYSPAYEINADLEKMMGSMSIYTIYNGYTLAYNALSPINASEWIPMGYIAPAAGEYTFSLDDVENIAEQVEHVYIIDYNANNIVDLMDEEYKFTTDKEQNDNRFAINVVLSQDKDNTTTGLDIIQGNNAAPIKFIYHDKIYIQSGGVIYDATGKQVTNINK